MRSAAIASFLLLAALVGSYMYWNSKSNQGDSLVVVEGDETSRKLSRHGRSSALEDEGYLEKIRILLENSLEQKLASMENLTRDFIYDQQEPRAFNPYGSDGHGWHQYLEMAKHVACEDSQPHPEYWCDTFYSQEETDKVQRELYDLQHPADCRGVPVLLLRADYPVGHGLGTFVHIFSTALTEAFEKNRVLLNHVDWMFSSKNTCTRHSLDCLFWPVSHCVASEDITSSGIPEDRIVSSSNLSSDSIVRFQSSPRETLPDKYKKKELHWWRAQLTKYILRPRPSLIELTALLQADVFPYGHAPRPLISLHIRHGGTNSPLLPARSYMWEIERRQLREKYQAKSIFVTTEDPEAITELTAEWSSSYDFFYVNTSRTNLEWTENIKYIGADREAALSFAQLFIAVQADFFVGTRSSHWCRLIDELRKTNGKAKTPYLSPTRDREAEW